MLAFTWPLLLPALSGSPEQRQAYIDNFGTDILFDGNTRVTVSGDLQLVTGLDNLRRAIHRRMITRPGEYKLNPGYGIGLQDAVKKPMTTSVLAGIKGSIVEQLSKDRRIQKVVDVTLTPGFNNNAVALEVSVTVQALGRQTTFEPFSFNNSPEA